MTTPTRIPPDEPAAELETEPADDGGLESRPPDAEHSEDAPADPEAKSLDGEPAGEAVEESEPAKERPFQSLIDLLHDLAIAVVVCVLLITYVVQAFKVQGTSMSPELLDGERILVNKFLYRFADIERGDVVVFWYPEDPELSFIKRVVGLPGEKVEIRGGIVYIDGTPIDESYVLTDNADRRSLASQEIRPGHYFVLGDNRRGSNDSRSWGLVPERYIYGKAFVRIWPIAEAGFVE